LVEQLREWLPELRRIHLQTRLRLQIEFDIWSTVSVTSRLSDQGDYSVAVSTKNQSKSKSGFVKEFLSDHPEGNVRAVNEAWQRAGNEGTIGDTVIYKTKSEMGLRGKVGQKMTRTATTKKSPSLPTAERTGLGKSSFVKEFLNDHPQGNVQAVNQAWLKAGMTGTISSASVSKMRASMGLTGNMRATSKTSSKATTTGKRRGRPAKNASAEVNGKPVSEPRAIKSDRTSALLGLEAEIDRLIFTVMGIGDLLEIETVLRDARLKVYRVLSN
jgi:hypothetical protein